MIAVVEGGRVAVVGDAVPACAVVPQDEGVAVGREALDAPADEVGQHLRIAHVLLAQALQRLRVEQAAVGVGQDAVAARVGPVAVAGGFAQRPVNLHDDIDLFAAAGRFHLVQVQQPRQLQVVVGIHIDEDGPVIQGGVVGGGGQRGAGGRRRGAGQCRRGWVGDGL